MKVIGIDFETANQHRHSACSVGLYFKDLFSGEVLYQREILINPECEFNYFNTMVNGINADMVVSSPTFVSAYDEILSLLNDDVLLLAHNASFDVSVLLRSCERYGLSKPSFKFMDTLTMSKAVLKGLPSYSLDYVADYIGLSSFQHHNALADAQACVGIFEHFLNLSECSDYSKLARKLGMRVGYYDNETDKYKFSSILRKNSKLTVDASDYSDADFDDSHPFYDKTFVFTGTLDSMSREIAHKRVLSCGGKVSEGISKKVNYLVTGYQNKFLLNGYEKSSKIRKAEQLVEKGADLEIITEDIFLKMI